MALTKYRLQDIAEVVGGGTPSTLVEENYGGEIVWITPKDLSNQNSKFIEQGERSISDKGFNSCSAQMIPAYNILMSSRAPIGLLAINKVECCTNQGFKSLILNKSICDVDYIYYYLKHHFQEIEGLGTGTTFKEVSKGSLLHLGISIPPLEEQQIKARLLSCIDAKIALNRSINHNLEAMAKQLYDYWFLQFDFPDENGKPYKSSGGKMAWNEKLKREIPEGWHCGNLFEIATFTNGLACQKFRPKDDEVPLPVIKIREMHDGISSDTEEVSPNIPESVKVYNGDVLFSWSASLEVMLWACGLGGLNQHIFKVTSANDFPKSFYYFQLLNYVDVFKKMAEARKTTMGHITQDHLQQSTIAIPDNKDIVDKFEKRISPIFAQMVKLQEEIQQLFKQRDELLPLLMNGQVSLNYDLSTD